MFNWYFIPIFIYISIFTLIFLSFFPFLKKKSGGQLQRLAMARALIRKPSILILDEATSNLDTLSESLIQTAIDNIKGDITTLIIAHRLSTVQNSDKIVVLDHGKVIEEGSHYSLMKKRGAYYDLMKAQE